MTGKINISYDVGCKKSSVVKTLSRHIEAEFFARNAGLGLFQMHVESCFVRARFLTNKEPLSGYPHKPYKLRLNFQNGQELDAFGFVAFVISQFPDVIEMFKMALPQSEGRFAHGSQYTIYLYKDAKLKGIAAFIKQLNLHLMGLNFGVGELAKEDVAFELPGDVKFFSISRDQDLGYEGREGGCYCPAMGFIRRAVLNGILRLSFDFNFLEFLLLSGENVIFDCSSVKLPDDLNGYPLFPTNSVYLGRNLYSLEDVICNDHQFAGLGDDALLLCRQACLRALNILLPISNREEVDCSGEEMRVRIAEFLRDNNEEELKVNVFRFIYYAGIMGKVKIEVDYDSTTERAKDRLIKVNEGERIDGGGCVKSLLRESILRGFKQ
jgi:hypothetical protein